MAVSSPNKNVADIDKGDIIHPLYEPRSRQLCMLLSVILSCACALLSVWSLIACYKIRVDTCQQIADMRHELMHLSFGSARMESADDMATAAEDDDTDLPVWLNSGTRRRYRRQTRSNQQNRGEQHNHPVKVIQFQMNTEQLQPGGDVEFDEIDWTTLGLHPGNHRSLLRAACSGRTDRTDCSTITVNETGIYFVYAQMLYFNALRHNSFNISVTSSTGTRCILRCDVTLDYVNRTSSGSQNAQHQSCHSGALTALAADDVIRLTNGRAGNKLSTAEGATYWGLIKLSPGHAGH